MEKNIELFPGSISDLERMTGETYRALRTDDNRLLRIDAKNTEALSPMRHPINYDAARKSLIKLARRVGADALVHVTYVPSVETEFIHKPITVPAFGYAVQRTD